MRLHHHQPQLQQPYHHHQQQQQQRPPMKHQLYHLPKHHVVSTMTSPRRRDDAVPAGGIPARCTWDDMFGRLLAFKARHLHTHVPPDYSLDPQLGRWSQELQAEYRQWESGMECANLTKDRADELRRIGWTPKAYDDTTGSNVNACSCTNVTNRPMTLTSEELMSSTTTTTASSSTAKPIKMVRFSPDTVSPRPSIKRLRNLHRAKRRQQRKSVYQGLVSTAAARDALFHLARRFSSRADANIPKDDSFVPSGSSSSSLLQEQQGSGDHVPRVARARKNEINILRPPLNVQDEPKGILDQQDCGKPRQISTSGSSINNLAFLDQEDNGCKSTCTIAATTTATKRRCPSPDSVQTKKRKLESDRWETSFQKLSEFYQTHHHTNVPPAYARDPCLALWIGHQRRDYVRWQRNLQRGTAALKTSMTEERARRLQDMGFEWQPSTSSSVSSVISSATNCNFVAKPCAAAAAISSSTPSLSSSNLNVRAAALEGETCSCG